MAPKLIQRTGAALALLGTTAVGGLTACSWGGASAPAAPSPQSSAVAPAKPETASPSPTASKSVDPADLPLPQDDRRVTTAFEDSVDGTRVIVSARTAEAIRRADVRLQAEGLPSLRLLQGSYHPGDPASAGTHDGGGTFDYATEHLTTAEARQTSHILAEEGGVVNWLRTDVGSEPHGHGVVVGDQELGWKSQAQVEDGLEGGNGLGLNRDGSYGPSHGKDALVASAEYPEWVEQLQGEQKP